VRNRNAIDTVYLKGIFSSRSDIKANTIFTDLSSIQYKKCEQLTYINVILFNFFKTRYLNQKILNVISNKASLKDLLSRLTIYMTNA